MISEDNELEYLLMIIPIISILRKIAPCPTFDSQMICQTRPIS